MFIYVIKSKKKLNKFKKLILKILRIKFISEGDL